MPGTHRVLPRVYGYLYARCGHDPDLAEELTQETFVEAIRDRRGFAGRADAVTWLCAIGRHGSQTTTAGSIARSDGRPGWCARSTSGDGTSSSDWTIATASSGPCAACRRSSGPSWC